MFRLLVIAILLSIWAAPARAETCPPTGTCWTWQVIGDTFVGGTGTFSASESTTPISLNGTYERFGTGFLLLTVTGCTDPGSECAYIAGYGNQIRAIEILGLGLIVQPILSGERQISFNLEAGDCPTGSFDGNFMVMQWNADGIGSDVSSSVQLGFGDLTWDSLLAIPAMVVNTTRNLVDFGTIMASPATLDTGTCSNGEATVTGGGDRGGVLYFATSAAGFLYRTNADHTFWGARATAITVATRAVLYGDYAGFSFDPSGASGVKTVGIELTSDLTAGDGYEVTDITDGTTNALYRRTLQIPSGATTLNGVTYPSGGGWNYPADGMISGTVGEGGGGGSYGNLVCLVISNVNNRQALFCGGQSPSDNSIPYNLVLANAVGAPGGDDTTFGTNGSVVYNSDDTDYLGHALALQTDGKIVVGGSAVPTSGSQDFALLRFLPDGDLDTGFGTGGKALGTLSANVEDLRAIALATDGKVIAVGSGNASGPGNSDMAIARFRTDGTLDTDFNGGNGYAFQAVGDLDDIAQSVALQTDGMIVVGGRFSHIGTAAMTDNGDWFLMRYRTDGTLDTGFGTAGIVTTHITTELDSLDGIAVDTAGRIVAVGYQTLSGPQKDSTIARYRSDGTLDTSFGSWGTGIVSSGSLNDDMVRTVTLGTDGNIFAAGYIQNFDRDFMVLIFDNAGGLLNVFTNPNGSGVTDEAHAVAVQADGQFIGLGTQNSGFDANVIAIRMELPSSYDFSFGTNSVRDTTFHYGGTLGLGIALQPDGRIVISSQTYTGTTFDDLTLLRFWP